MAPAGQRAPGSLLAPERRLATAAATTGSSTSPAASAVSNVVRMRGAEAEFDAAEDGGGAPARRNPEVQVEGEAHGAADAEAAGLVRVDRQRRVQGAAAQPRRQRRAE